MPNERPDNTTSKGATPGGSTTTKRGPQKVPAASPDPDETRGQAADGQGESTSAHEIIVQPPTSSPNNTGETADTTHVSATQDANATWDPGQSDTLAHGASSDEESGETWSPTHADPDSPPGHHSVEW